MRQATRCNNVLLSSLHNGRSTTTISQHRTSSSSSIAADIVSSPSSTSPRTTTTTTSRIPLGAALGLSKRYSNILGRTRVTGTSSSSSLSGGVGSSVVDSGFVVTEEVPSKLLSDWRPWVGEHRKSAAVSVTTTPSVLGDGNHDASGGAIRTVHQGRRAPGSTDLAVSVSQVSAARFMGTVESISVGFTDALVARERLLHTNSQPPTSTPTSNNTTTNNRNQMRGGNSASTSATKRSGLTSTSSPSSSSSSSATTKASIGGPFTCPVVSITLSLPSEVEGGAPQKIVVLCPLSSALCARFIAAGGGDGGGDVVGDATSAKGSSSSSVRLAESLVLDNLRATTGLEVSSRVIVAGSLRSVLRAQVVSSPSSSGHTHTFPSSFVELPQDGVWNGAVTVV